MTRATQFPSSARYRKEATGELSDEILRDLSVRLEYLRNIEAKKEEVTRLIDEQGKMDDEIRSAIEKASTITELDDIYRPFRPKRRTRATIAKEKGLEPLAQLLLTQENKNPDAAALDFLDVEKGVETTEDALAGAMDIIAEIISDNPDYRKLIREITYKNGLLSTKAVKEEESVYDMYAEFSEAVPKIANHRILAINRGEKEGFLRVNLEVDENMPLQALYQHILAKPATASTQYVQTAAEDAYKRLIAPSIETEIRNLLTERAGDAAIKVFAKNLNGLLLQPPIKNRTVLGLDPGYRTGCKVAVVDDTGKVLATNVVYCNAA